MFNDFAFYLMKVMLLREPESYAWVPLRLFRF